MIVTMDPVQEAGIKLDSFIREVIKPGNPTAHQEIVEWALSQIDLMKAADFHCHEEPHHLSAEQLRSAPETEVHEARALFVELENAVVQISDTTARIEFLERVQFTLEPLVERFRKQCELVIQAQAAQRVDSVPLSAYLPKRPLEVAD